MLKKTVLHNALKMWTHGDFTVRYWDGDEKNYGDGEPQFSIVFHKEPHMKDLKLTTDISLVLGEAYMDGIVDFEGDLDDIIDNMFKMQDSAAKTYDLKALRKKMTAEYERQEKTNIQYHYDIGNDFYAKWLDPTMCYSCAYFQKPEDSLYQAQINKVDHSLAKLSLKPGEELLDIGCGWGTLIIRAAQKYGVKATGITLSKQQYDAVSEKIANLNLGRQVRVLLLDYMDLDPALYQFDKIISIGMFEHVGKEFLPLYLHKVSTLLRDKGLFMLHSIMGFQETLTNAWMKRYIFPGGYVPTVRETVNYFIDFNFYLLHMESLRRHYAKTLTHWYENFEAIKDTLPEEYDDRFKRMWGIYLSGCASAFRTGHLDVVQFLLSKGPNNDLPMTNEYMYPEECPVEK